jgi:RNA polymerase-binding transcription factor DksA
VADEVDRAQDAEELFRALSLAALKLGLTREPASPNPGRCVDCAEKIEAKRLKLNPEALLCIECQRAENEHKTGFKRPSKGNE